MFYFFLDGFYYFDFLIFILVVMKACRGILVTLVGGFIVYKLLFFVVRVVFTYWENFLENFVNSRNVRLFLWWVEESCGYR